MNNFSISNSIIEQAVSQSLMEFDTIYYGSNAFCTVSNRFTRYGALAKPAQESDVFYFNVLVNNNFINFGANTNVISNVISGVYHINAVCTISSTDEDCLNSTFKLIARSANGGKTISSPITTLAALSTNYTLTLSGDLILDSGNDSISFWVLCTTVPSGVDSDYIIESSRIEAQLISTEEPF